MASTKLSAVVRVKKYRLGRDRGGSGGDAGGTYDAHTVTTTADCRVLFAEDGCS